MFYKLRWVSAVFSCGLASHAQTINRKGQLIHGTKGQTLISKDTTKRLSYPTAASSITAKRPPKRHHRYPSRIELERAVRVVEEGVTRDWGRCKMWRTST